MPKSWRSGRWSLVMAWGSMFGAVFWLYIAAMVAATVGTTNALIGIAASVLVWGGINYVLSQYAIRTGLTVALLSRRLFGLVGSLLAPLIFAATATYYSVFEGSVVAQALHSYFGVGDIRLWYLLVVLYSIPLVMGGVRTWLDKLNGALLPFYVIGMAALVIWASVKHPASLSLPDQRTDLAAPGWVWAFTVYMGVWVLMMYTVDFARFGKPADIKFHRTFTFGPVFYTLTLLVNGLIGIFLAATVPGVLGLGGITETGMVNAITGTMGVFGLLLIVISQTRINSANLYLASSNLEAFVSRVIPFKLHRAVFAVAAGVLVYIIMLTDVFSYILRALNWQGVFVVAWVGIALTHIVLTRTKETLPEFRPGRLKAFTPAVAVWLVVSLLGIYLVEGAGTVGATWSAPITLALSVVGYAIAFRFDSLLHRDNDPRDEVDDVWEARIRCHACEKSYIAVEIDRDPSAGYKAICSACAASRPGFHAAARRDAEPTAQLAN
uniref:Putative permease for cytosine/purines,uracil,thiamine, allantoin transporter n=2 Tax=Rhodococcus TaxID=1827 RepID=B5MAD2_9NOCA|nr:putative permease for cytosine/purines,uracil,thiamine, allantoin transporter [Rhodococcus sp. PY11]